MVEQHRGHSSTVLVLMFVAGLILGGMVTTYVLYRQITTLRDDLSNVEGQVSNISGNLTITNQTIIVTQNINNQTITVIQNTTDLTETYDQVKDSVVLIEGKTSSGTVQGSGFIYNYSGSMIVITNNHVVHGTTSLSVTFSDGKGYAATVKGTDPYSDLAVVSVANAPNIEFKPLEIVESSALRVGNPVIAIGNPYGLVGSMTTGVISAVGRTISEEYTGGFAIANIIQTSTPINPGNSGGPLLNVLGNVVGITTAIVENSQGLGFAVPSNTMLKEIPSLFQFGNYVNHSYLGVNGTDMDYETAQSMKTNVTYGWLVSSVVQNGPAATAGVQANDVIIGVNGTTVISGDGMTSYIEDKTLPRETVILTVVRGNHTLSLPLVLGKRPAPPA